MHPNKVDLDMINKFLVHDIMNQETIEVIEEILQRNQIYDHEVPEWPGLGFDITSDDGKALLGKQYSSTCFQASQITQKQDLRMDSRQGTFSPSTRHSLARTNT